MLCEVANGLSLLFVSHFKSLYISHLCVFTIKDNTAKCHAMHPQAQHLGMETGQGVEELQIPMLACGHTLLPPAQQRL